MANIGFHELKVFGAMFVLTAALYMQKYNNKGLLNNENCSYSRRIQ